MTRGRSIFACGTVVALVAAAAVLAPSTSRAGACDGLGELDPGTELEGVDLGGALEGQTWAAIQLLEEAWLDTPITLTVGGATIQRTRRALGAVADHEATCARLASLEGGGEVHFVRSVDGTALRTAITALAAELDRSPVLPRIDFRTEQWVEGREGRLISALEAVRVVEAALLRGDSVIDVPVRVLPVPAPSEVPMAEATYTHTLATFTTRYALSEEQWGRAANIVNASSAIDGALIPPGGELSFNEVVGARSIDRGYRPADEVVSGRVVDGIGGGVCQVAATLHASAFLAGLEIVEHHPHARGSRYIDVGLDAAVSWPSVDLRVRNPFSFPLRVRSHAARGVLTVSLLGAADGPDVQWSTEIVERVTRGTEVLAPGDEREPDEGVDGLVVRRDRTLRSASGIRRESVTLRYPQVSALVAGSDAP